MQQATHAMVSFQYSSLLPVPIGKGSSKKLLYQEDDIHLHEEFQNFHYTNIKYDKLYLKCVKLWHLKCLELNEWNLHIWPRRF